MSKVYFINLSTDESDDKSLFVSAENPLEAVQMWSTHYEQDFDIERTEIAHPGREMRFGAWISVYEVPSSNHTVVFNWSAIEATYLLVRLD